MKKIAVLLISAAIMLMFAAGAYSHSNYSEGNIPDDLPGQHDTCGSCHQHCHPGTAGK